MYQRENIFTKQNSSVSFSFEKKIMNCKDASMKYWILAKCLSFFMTSIWINTNLINCHGSFNFYILLNKFKILLKLKKLLKQSIRFFKKIKKQKWHTSYMIQQKKVLKNAKKVSRIDKKHIYGTTRYFFKQMIVMNFEHIISNKLIILMIFTCIF